MLQNNKLPFEQHAKDEAEYNKIAWANGPYEFLLNRTEEKYKHKSNSIRRRMIEDDLKTILPVISDEILKSLYLLACSKYQRKSFSNYDSSSGFLKTSFENTFLKTVEQIIKDEPKLKHLEIYPSQNYSKYLPVNFKIVVGNYVPDFIIFGLKKIESSAVVFEINGPSHEKKSAKDILRDLHLEELKIFTVQITNEQAADIAYIKAVLLSLYRLRNGSFNTQIKRVKRLIFTKTISCHLSLAEIEAHVFSTFGITLNLKQEAKEIIKQPDCPRIIKRELKLAFGEF